ncbi:hypothetical protein [Ekhidna sp.]|uniref:hypothetical protein n=1 Tax=Ekhidna sp. TaxID=2608089 RepID=UPI003BAA6CAE
MKDDFYIGWSNEAPQSHTSKAKLFFVGVLIGMVSIGVIYVKNQHGYIDSIYDYGIIQEFSGYLVKDPIWGLRVEEDGKIKTIPLVGFGKMGPDRTLSKMMETHELKEGTMVTLRGMVFHYQDKYWMELTERENSLVSAGSQTMVDRNIRMIGYKELEGEIVDPKCFFGVMNPAVKAVHRSCAIRCISGGMPPLLAIRENGIFVDYYFLHGKEMESIADQILPYVGVPVKVSGVAAIYDDWKSLIIDVSSLTLNKESETSAIAFCY